MSGPLDPLEVTLGDGVRAVFTTRCGGVSAHRWATLNLGLHVQDSPDLVLENRDRLAHHFDGCAVRFPQQVHGAGVLVLSAAEAGRPAMTGIGAPGVDALVTREAATPIGVLVADCLPVLIADPRGGVVAAVHAGRRGLASGVLAVAVDQMVAQGAREGECVAVIGPAVCGRCYEVPALIRDEVSALVPGSAASTADGAPSLDLPAGAVEILQDLGVAEVRNLAICTVEDDRFYSYRRDGVTGRFAGVVMLEGHD